MANPESSKSPAFQFYPADFIGDSNVAGMSLQERGAYITLICYCWIDGTLPASTDRLARLCKAPLAAFRRLWPALEPCFRADSDTPGRLIHPRLERERQKQAEYRHIQSLKGKASGVSRNRKATGSEPETNRSSTGDEPDANRNPTLQSSSSSSSSDFSQGTTDARSKHPVFKGQRFVVFDWMLADLSRMLGSHAEAFDFHAWFYELDEQAVAADVVVPQRDGGKWLQERTHEEALRRGLPIAVQTHNPKTAGNVAAAARFIARGQR